MLSWLYSKPTPEELAQRALIEAEAELFEEIRMISQFEIKEIKRLKTIFYNITNDNNDMTLTEFFTIQCIFISPFREKIAKIFGFTHQKLYINVKEFICGISLFNSIIPSNRINKMRVAFQLQDIDNDGVITLTDLIIYLNLVSNNKLETYERKEISQHILNEISSDNNKKFITFTDYQRFLTTTDFQMKLHLPI